MSWHYFTTVLVIIGTIITLTNMHNWNWIIGVTITFIGYGLAYIGILNIEGEGRRLEKVKT